MTEHDDAEKTALPRRLLDLDAETVGWLDRLTTEERTALIWAGHLPKFKRDRLDLFLALEQDKFQAGFTIVELYTRTTWIAKTSMKLLLYVAGALVAVNQVMAYFGASGGKH
ncbi:MAG: hypothetical protein E5Y67_03640 [Mesorhizobium sp.]|uniref:hypothetical protein n=1 Tax=Mesorhizobium sp. TaxID=1871066 RepID=UPI00121B2F09|nr:hypothetical protein [Mesorhizobium sp.]TIM16298.1 MAG: hypothetical protein E5Y67_03640 [Mesorhizobium sp.]